MGISGGKYNKSINNNDNTFIDKHISAECDANILVGQPLYLKSNKHLDLASNNNNHQSQLIGIATSNSNIGFTATYTSFGSVVLNDWTNIIGNVSLVPGLDYFLDNIPGKMTTVAPNSGYWVYCGRAVTDKCLVVDFQLKIQL